MAKALGNWWGCVFRRTPSSGAWTKQGQSRNSKQSDAAAGFHGDIVAPPEAEFPFSVECKTYKEVELYKALYGESNIFEWWAQCQEDAKRVDKEPMLVMKENFKQPLVAVSAACYLALRFQLPKSAVPRMTLRYDHICLASEQMVIFSLQGFISKLNPEMVKKLLARSH